MLASLTESGKGMQGPPGQEWLPVQHQGPRLDLGQQVLQQVDRRQDTAAQRPASSAAATGHGDDPVHQFQA